MGLSSSPYVFSKISDMVVRCAMREGVPKVINYLDDYCIVSPDHDTACWAQGVMIGILRRIGFYVSFAKLISPATSVRFLGIIIDTVELRVSLPQDKLEKLLRILTVFQGRKKATRREMESLGGLLAHCSKVVKGGRTFCRRIYDCINTVREPYFKIRLSGGFREDIDWWCQFASRFNGSAKILGKFAAHIATYSDASNWGFGAIHANSWIAGAFDRATDEGMRGVLGHHHLKPHQMCESAHINVREMWAAYAAALRWGKSWAGASVVMVTDSTTVRAALNTGRSTNESIMYFLRRLFWIAVDNNFEFSSVYIKSGDNILCDALSRLDEPASTGRIRVADPGGRMCCSQIFSRPTLCVSRGGEAAKGAEGLPGEVLRDQLDHDEGSTGEEVPGIRGGLLGIALAPAM